MNQLLEPEVKFIHIIYLFFFLRMWKILYEPEVGYMDLRVVFKTFIDFS